MRRYRRHRDQRDCGSRVNRRHDHRERHHRCGYHLFAASSERELCRRFEHPRHRSRRDGHLPSRYHRRQRHGNERGNRRGSHRWPDYGIGHGRAGYHATASDHGVCKQSNSEVERRGLDVCHGELRRNRDCHGNPDGNRPYRRANHYGRYSEHSGVVPIAADMYGGPNEPLERQRMGVHHHALNASALRRWASANVHK